MLTMQNNTNFNLHSVNVRSVFSMTLFTPTDIFSNVNNFMIYTCYACTTMYMWLTAFHTRVLTIRVQQGFKLRCGILCYVVLLLLPCKKNGINLVNVFFSFIIFLNLYITIITAYIDNTITLKITFPSCRTTTRVAVRSIVSPADSVACQSVEGACPPTWRRHVVSSSVPSADNW